MSIAKMLGQMCGRVLFDGAATSSQKHIWENAEQLFEHVRSLDGVTPFMIGSYSQGLARDSEILQVPMIIALSDEQLEIVADGQLEGVIYEKMGPKRTASVSGRISDTKLQFGKHYQTETDPEVVAIRRAIRESFTPERKGQPYTFTGNIIYKGQATEPGTYRGIWTLKTSLPNDFQSTGNFVFARLGEDLSDRTMWPFERS